MSNNGEHGWLTLSQCAAESDLNNLEELLGKLYDDVDSKVQASRMILSWTLRVECLGAIASHASALGALARVLREEGRKCFDLRQEIVSIFFIFSFFRNFHQILFEQQIGRTTLQILEMEVQRTQNLYRRYECTEDCLCEVLKRKNTSLLIIVVEFLKKLSVYKENIDCMKDKDIILQITNLLQHRNEALLNSVLRVIWNLSFDRSIRKDMVWGILYNLSMDVDLRLKIAESDVFSILLQSILAEHLKGIPKELVALAINLTCLSKVAKLKFEPSEMEKFIAFILRIHDPLLFKVIRNISLVEDARTQLILKNDLDISLQSMYAFSKFLLFDSTRTDLLYLSNKVFIRILELSQDSNNAIVKMADHLIKTICELDQLWFEKIRRWRFKMYNPDWMHNYEVIRKADQLNWFMA